MTVIFQALNVAGQFRQQGKLLSSRQIPVGNPMIHCSFSWISFSSFKGNFPFAESSVRENLPLQKIETKGLWEQKTDSTWRSPLMSQLNCANGMSCQLLSPSGYALLPRDKCPRDQTCKFRGSPFFSRLNPTKDFAKLLQHQLKLLSGTFAVIQRFFQ